MNQLTGVLTKSGHLIGRIAKSDTLRGTLSKTSTLAGYLAKQETLNGKLSTIKKLSGRITSENFLVGTLTKFEGSDFYTGDYTVDAKVSNDILLPTKNKTMIDDVKVNKIRVSTTSNLAGGTTVYIAEGT